jgi:alpha-mannosidase
MRRLILLAVLITGVFNSALAQQRELVVNYYKPYSYNLSGNTVSCWISTGNPGQKLSIALDGKNVPYTPADSGRIKLELPLAGKESELVISEVSGNKLKLLSKQIFHPLVPSEWGYFGKGSINIICSSHQDIAWMNTPDSCKQERIEKIILPALDMIGKNPSFKFEMEQTLNLMEVLEAVPAEKGKIINAYRSGQFTWGATYNQPYEGLESGEQLVRQAYFGRRWIRENLTGMDALIAYNVDVPGRTLQSPQILSSAGIKYLFVSRMKEGFVNWYSPDGSRILTYSPGNYGWALLVYRYFEDDVITAMQKLHEVLSNWDAYYREHNLPPHYAIIISTDAGGPKDYSKIAGEWNAIVKAAGLDIPIVQHSTAEEFLGKIDVPGIRLDSIAGDRPDLWLYIHGPAHYEAIRAKKSAAVTLPSAEIFSSLAGLVTGSQENYPASDLYKGWMQAIYPDHGWGGKHGEITDSIFRASLEAGDKSGRILTDKALETIAGKIGLKKPGAIVVFNDLSWKRSGYVSVTVPGRNRKGWIILDASGNTVPSDVTESSKGLSISFEARSVPSVGYKTFYLEKKVKDTRKEIVQGSNFCENRFYRIRFGNGGIKSLFDKVLGKEIFNTSKYAGGDLLDIGYNGNGAGEFIQIKPTNFELNSTLSSQNSGWQLKASSDLSSVFESETKMRNFTVRQTITVYHDQKRIDFEYDIPDWTGEHNRQIRAAFPLKMNSAAITYDVPMGTVTVGRDELKNSPLGWSWEGTYRQLPAEINPREIENFISASDKNSGVTLSTDLAVADWIDPGRESVDYPVLQGILLSSHKSCHYLGNWYHQTGSHHFRISFTTHEPGWKNGYQFGVEENHPLLSVTKEKTQVGKLPEEASFVSVSSPFVRITALKKSESGNDLIMRMVEMEGSEKETEVRLLYPVKEILKTNLIEEDQENLGQGGSLLKINLRKNSIETLRLKY